MTPFDGGVLVIRRKIPDDDFFLGVYAYGFERPSAIQQRAIMPIIQGKFSSPSLRENF